MGQGRSIGIVEVLGFVRGEVGRRLQTVQGAYGTREQRKGQCGGVGEGDKVMRMGNGTPGTSGQGSGTGAV